MNSQKKEVYDDHLLFPPKEPSSVYCVVCFISSALIVMFGEKVKTKDRKTVVVVGEELAASCPSIIFFLFCVCLNHCDQTDSGCCPPTIIITLPSKDAPPCYIYTIQATVVVVLLPLTLTCLPFHNAFYREGSRILLICQLNRGEFIYEKAPGPSPSLQSTPPTPLLSMKIIYKKRKKASPADPLVGTTPPNNGGAPPPPTKQRTPQ